MSRRPALVAAVAALLATALLAGCTSGDEPAPAASPSSTPPATTAAPTPTATDPTSLVRDSAGAARTAPGATYTYVLAGRDTPKSPVDRISGVGRIEFGTDTAATRGDLGLASAGSQFDVVTRGTLYWIGVPPRHRSGYVKTPFVSTTVRVARLGMSTLGHPGTYLDVLRGAEGMAEVGQETVRDVRTRHFRGRLSVARMLDALPAEMRDATRPAYAGITDVHLEVWLDPQGRPWRVRTRLPRAANRPEVESAFDVTRYGTVTPVLVPDRVTPLPHMDAVLNAIGVGRAR